MGTISKSTNDLINVQGASTQLATLKTSLTATQKAIFTATDTKRMYFCEKDKDAVMLGSEVQNVTYENGILTITPVNGASIPIEITIDKELGALQETITNAYTNAIATAKTETLEEVGDNYINKDKIVDTPGESSDEVLSAKGAKTLVEYTQTKVSGVTGNLVDNTTATNPAVNLFYEYNTDDKKIYFYRDENLTQKVGSGIDVTPFIKDGMLKDTEIVVASSTNKVTIDGTEYTTGTFIKFTWNTDGGDKVDYLNVTSLIDTYLAGDGLSLDTNTKTFSIKLVSTSGLKVNSNGLGVLAGTGITVDATGVNVNETWLPTKVISSINGKAGAVTIEGGTVTSSALGGVNMQTIDVHPKWYTISES